MQNDRRVVKQNEDGKLHRSNMEIILLICSFCKKYGIIYIIIYIIIIIYIYGIYILYTN